MRRALPFLILAACGDDPAATPDAPMPRDAATIDAATIDAATIDAAGPDARPPDGSVPDAMLPDGSVDAASPDASVPSWEVPCAGATIAATITTSKSDFAPEHVTIPAGAIVRFQPLNPHDATAGTFASPEPWFRIDGNTTGCVRFDEPGTYPFFCSAHPFSMTGEITVVSATAAEAVLRLEHVHRGA